MARMRRRSANASESQSEEDSQALCSHSGHVVRLLVILMAFVLAILHLTETGSSMGSIAPSVTWTLQSNSSSRIQERVWNATGSSVAGSALSGMQSSLSPKRQSKGKPKSRHEDLRELTRFDEDFPCTPPLQPVQMVSNPQADEGLGRRIPKIVHITGKTRCLTLPFTEATKLWQFENHSFYFHDDQAVDDLFNREWPMFPQIKNALTCLKGAGGAAKADLWRYLALYEYGGIYTDMDNHPNTLFNATSIPKETDAFFLQESGGFLSQYFFAVSPKHPLMFLAVHDVMQQMHSMADTGSFYVPATSGPGAIKRAFIHFMGLNSTNLDDLAAKYSKPTTGHYEGVGFGNHSVTVFGNRRTNNDYVKRTAVKGFEKMHGWREMGIENYQALNKKTNGKTCIRVLHEYYSEQTGSETLKEAYRRQRW